MKKKEDPIVHPISKASESELRDEVEKLKQQVMEASKSSATERPERDLKEMIEKLEREIEYEYDEAVEALGMEDKFLVLREEAAKGRNTPALQEKIEQLKGEFAKNLPSAPNYHSLVSKIEMLKELSKSGANKDELKIEINKRFGEFMNRPDVKHKVETLKAEIANLGLGASDLDSRPEIKDKVMRLNGELESEFKAVLESLGLQVVPKNQDAALEKINAFSEEVHMVIDDVVNSSDLKERIELLKAEVEILQNSPDEDSKAKIQSLVAEMRQTIKEAISFPELKEKHERLTAEILESSNGSLDKEEEEEDSQVKVNQDTNRSFV